MHFLVHRKLARLTKSALASLIVTFKGLLVCMDVHVLFQVLGQSKCFEADHAYMFFCRAVRSEVSSKRKTSGVSFFAASIITLEWSFHLKLFSAVQVLKISNSFFMFF